MSHEQLGPYKLGRRIGKGGMGSVYEAIDQNSGERIAVKSLSPQLAAAEGFRERFEAEIESLKILQHDGIVRLLAWGEHDDGTLFYSMELVDGPSLEEELNASRRFDWKETLNIGVQTCRALKHAHDHGIVHRDIKPANLLLAADDQVKIADFGIARLFGFTRLTTAGGVLGTADYMSPEQADGRPVTEKCDQYSLGCVMYALLAGRPPFRARTMPEMLQMQRFAEPEPVRRYAPDAPEQLDQLIQQLLSKDPEGRFPNVMVLARHMEAMAKALSRPGKGADPAEAPVAGRAEPSVDRTSAANPEETLAQDPPAKGATADSIDILVPDEVYDAPTMAVEDQDSAVLPKVIEPVPEPPRPKPQPATRFTTVDQEVQREQARGREDRWILAAQMAGLIAALAAVVGLGWMLMRPSTADELYDEIVAAAEADDSRALAAAVKQFDQRFADDARSADLALYREEVELQRLERQLKIKSRVGGASAAHPAARSYVDAMAVAEQNPGRGAAMLENLIALYGDQASGDLGEQGNPWLILAGRQLAKLRQAEAELADNSLPVISERLSVARRLEIDDPAMARRMYQAIVSLYGDRPWASQIVQQAANRLDELDR